MFVRLVYVTVFVVSVCGLAWQLVMGAAASYLLGDSVTQFSIATGVFLSALGLGASLSRRIEHTPGRAFVDLAYTASLTGGSSVALIFLAYGHSGFFRPVLYGTLLATGALVGLELPLLLRVLRRAVSVRELAARALAVDYAGAVVGSLAVSLLVIPRLGLVRTAVAFGLLHALAALVATYTLGPVVGPPVALRVRGVLTLGVLAGLFALTTRFTALAEDAMFPDPVVYARRSPYQRIVFTSGRGSLQLFLDGNLQFASVDERRYHEALVHPAMSAARSHANVLVLGGGDGLATRELLRYPDVARVTLVDLDSAITDLARTFPPLVALNGDSLHASRVTVVNADAMVWLAEQPAHFDVVVVDFPDPNNFALGKLYTRRFYSLLRAHLAPGGVAVVQSTSPLVARRSFWCIAHTIESAGLSVLPYHAFVPSFGEWGYVLASENTLQIPTRTLPGLAHLNDAVMPTLFVFGNDMARVESPVNVLNNQVLVQMYEQEWRRFQ